MWHHQYPPQGSCPPRICPPAQQYRGPSYLPPQQQYSVPQSYPPRIHPPPQQYGAPSYPPQQSRALGYPAPQQQYNSPQGGYPPQGFPRPQQYGALISSPPQQQYGAPQGGYPPHGYPLLQQHGNPGYPPPQQQYGVPQGHPPQQQFSPLPGQYPPQQHGYGASPPGQYGAPRPGPPPGQYGAPPPGHYGAPNVQHYGVGPPASHIRQVESLATSRVESEDAMSTHDSSPPSETTNTCCYWCSRISIDDNQTRPSPDESKWLRKLFHSDCECRRRENAFPSSACGFCKHLNLRHLVRCALLRNKLPSPTIFSDWYCRENPQIGCQLCEYIAPYGTCLSEIGLAIFDHPNKPWYILTLTTTDGENDIRLSQDRDLQLQEHVNWEQIREWTSELNPEEGNLLVDFRVIDVQRNCIVTPDYPVNYIALSYVWESSAQKEKPFQASVRNIKDLEIEGSLSGAPLPRTITDAMEVCRQLNQKYLWVDRLCIIQDHESKHGQIQHMDSIFKSSEFTIIALSGRDANDGLAGVSKPRKSHRLKILEWQGFTLTNTFPDIKELVATSYWGKRGWTFQEEFCSKNNLYFTEYGVYQSKDDLRLHTECFAENLDYETLSFCFPDSVEAYAARSFTDPGDLLRAFTGALNICYGGRHHFGNAAAESNADNDSFHAWIHWQPVDWEYEARRPPKDVSMKPFSHLQLHESDIFPSWSWTSAQGGVHFYEDVIPVSLWAFPVDRESQEDSNVVWVSHNCDAYRLREITVEGGLMSNEEFPVQLENNARLISASSTVFEKAGRDEACKKLGRVLSFTQIASLHLECFDSHFRDGRRTFRIISSSGECIGGIHLPKLSLEYISNRDGGLRDKEFEFIALSTYWAYWDEDVERNLKGVGLKAKKGQEVLNVMLIWQVKDSNVSRRLGIGHVYQDKWLKEGPVLKTIILE